jgi:beta-aspartyl-dipeptidase (metallo-type)
MLHLLRNAELYTPEPLGRRHLLVAGGSVVWIGEEIPALDAHFHIEDVDLEGRRVIPGLIDGHAHITGGGGEAGYASRVPPVSLSRFTLGGVTTVVGVLGTDDCVRTTAELVATARGLCADGLSAFCHTGGYHLPPVTLTGSIRGDIVHIDRVLGAGEIALSDHRSSQPTFDELVRLAAEVHVAGLMTGKAGILHLHLGDGPRGLDLVRRAIDQTELPARVFNPTHVNRRKGLFDEALELADRGVTIDITAFAVSAGEDAWPAPDALLRYLDGDYPAERVTVSSDGGGCLPRFDAEGAVIGFGVGNPGSLADTLHSLLARGQALERVLPAFTSNVARLLRLPTKGRLAEGSDADLVSLSADGLVCDVMAQGRWHLRDGCLVRRGTFEGAAG